MAYLKLLFLSLLILTADGVHDTEPDSSLRLQLDQLNSKISLLESRIDERSLELRRKDERIKELESSMDLKLANLASLQSELQLLQEKESVNAIELVAKANVRATELEHQIDVLRRQIEEQNKKKHTLESSTNKAEEKIQQLTLKLESLQRINEEQNARIRKTKRALQVAEEEMMRAKLEVSSVSKQLEEVKEGWLPPWLAVHLVHFQSIMITYWNEHGRPALDLTIQKALETKSEVIKLAEPHMHSLKTKWIPAVKERSVELVHDAGPHVQRLKTKTIDLYYTSKKFMEPHIVNAHEVIQPYIQEATKLTEPYVAQISVAMTPHIDKARILLQPYTKKVHRHYRKVKKSISLYHHQVQENIHHLLKNHEITKPYATNKLAWYLASAVLALPLIFLFNLVSDFTRKKPKKHSRRHHHTGQTRRAKRAHPDK